MKSRKGDRGWLQEQVSSSLEGTSFGRSREQVSKLQCREIPRLPLDATNTVCFPLHTMAINIVSDMAPKCLAVAE